MTEPIINIYPPAGTPGWVNGLFILGGAIAGGGLTLLSTKFSDKRKFTNEAAVRTDQLRREDARRWDQRLQEVAARFVGSTYKAIQAFEAAEREIANIPSPSFKEQSDALGRPGGLANLMAGQAAMREAANEPLRAAEAEASGLLAELLMIAPDSVGDDARKLWMHTSELLSSDNTRDQSRKDYEEQRGRLIVVVKSVLRSKEGDATVVAVAAEASAAATTPAVGGS